MEEEINVLTDAIMRLEAELGRAPTEARHDEIVETLQVMKAMRIAIIAKKGVSAPN